VQVCEVSTEVTTRHKLSLTLWAGTGIHIRTSNSLDVEDEVDIDGEDEAVFGEAQFGEADVLALPSSDRDLHHENEDIDVDIDGHVGTSQERQTLRHLVVEGKVLMKQADSIESKVIQSIEMDQLDLDIVTARSRNDPSALILALENKLKTLVSSWHDYIHPRLIVDYRNLMLVQHLHLTYAVSVFHTIPSRQCQRDAGTHVVVNVGFAVWGRPSSVPCANESPALQS